MSEKKRINRTSLCRHPGLECESLGSVRVQNVLTTRSPEPVGAVTTHLTNRQENSILVGWSLLVTQSDWLMKVNAKHMTCYAGPHLPNSQVSHRQ